MRAYLVRVVFAVCFLINVLCQKVVKNSKGEFFYLSFKHLRPIRRPLSDIETVTALGFTASTIATVDDDYLNTFVLEGDLGSLKHADSSPDEQMRVRIVKVMLLAPTPFVRKMHRFNSKINPSIEAIEGQILMAWRENIYEHQGCIKIHMAWLNETDLTHMPPQHRHLGLDNFVIPNITRFPFNQMQEDPRLLYLHSGKQLVVMYTSKESLMKPVEMSYVNFTLEHHKNINISSTAHDSVMMPFKAHDMYDSPKNWVPMIYTDHKTLQEQLLFIQNIHPIRLLQHTATDTSSHTATMNVIQRDPINQHNATSTTPPPLPWNPHYGSLIRGGTPAIHLRHHHVHIAFFHTVANYWMHTYFMGAVTFCSSHPLKIHSISPLPIIPTFDLYDGAWVETGKLDYVVFPTG